MAAPRCTANVPYFAFETEVKPVPDEPTHCKGCAHLLEPLRRYGGYCAGCVAEWRKRLPPPKPPATMTVVRTMWRKRVGQREGHRERFVLVRCSCGQRRMLKLSTWNKRRPTCCNQCRMKAINDRGFEAEHVR